jgi:CheY-like chemotaxis protein
MIAHAIPDVVLCDLRMPRMDGYEFIHELHRRSSLDDLPVVAISGLGSAEDRRRTRDAGFESHIMKPFDTRTIAAVVDAAIAHRDERRIAAGQAARASSGLGAS